MKSASHWIALHTKPNQERIALENLERQSFRTYCPMITERRKRVNESDVKRRPLFPGYIFVAFSQAEQPWRPLRSTRGVNSIVMVGDTPGRLPTGFIDELIACELSGDLDLLATPMLREGDRVIIKDGPFRDLLAEVVGRTEQDRVWLLLEMMGRRVKITHTHCDLERLD